MEGTRARGSEGVETMVGEGQLDQRVISSNPLCHCPRTVCGRGVCGGVPLRPRDGQLEPGASRDGQEKELRKFCSMLYPKVYKACILLAKESLIVQCKKEREKERERRQNCLSF